MDARVLKSDGSTEVVAPKNGTDFQLDELQSIVGGYIEMVYPERGTVIVVNEEGLLQNLPFNHLASIAAGRMLVGNVLICPSRMVQ